MEEDEEERSSVMLADILTVVLLVVFGGSLYWLGHINGTKAELERWIGLGNALKWNCHDRKVKEWDE